MVLSYGGTDDRKSIHVYKTRGNHQSQAEIPKVQEERKGGDPGQYLYVYRLKPEPGKTYPVFKTVDGKQTM
jgi:hypothetical protein